MGFREWLKVQEAGTGTNCVAGFARMTLPLVRRSWAGLSSWGDADPFFRKKKKGGKVRRD